MRTRLLSGAVFAAAAYLIPLLGSWSLYSDPRVWFAVAAAVAVMFVQPTLTVADASDHADTDKGTAQAIVGVALLTQLVSTLEVRLREPMAHPLAEGIGVSMVLAGLAIRAIAIRALGPSFTATVQVRPGQRIVDRGLYGVVRHPSYLGGLLAIVGVPVVFGTFWSAAGALVAMLLVYARRIAAEEAALVTWLGTAYESYRQRTWALVPFLW